MEVFQYEKRLDEFLTDLDYYDHLVVKEETLFFLHEGNKKFLRANPDKIRLTIELDARFYMTEILMCVLQRLVPQSTLVNLEFNSGPLDLLTSIGKTFRIEYMHLHPTILLTSVRANEDIMEIGRSLAGFPNLDTIDISETFTAGQLFFLFSNLGSKSLRFLSFNLDDVFPPMFDAANFIPNLQIIYITIKNSDVFSSFEYLLKSVEQRGKCFNLTIDFRFVIGETDLFTIRKTICESRFNGALKLDFDHEQKNVSILNDIVCNSKLNKIIFNRGYTLSEILTILEATQKSGRLHKAFEWRYGRSLLMSDDDVMRLIKLIRTGNFRSVSLSGEIHSRNVMDVVRAFGRNPRFTSLQVEIPRDDFGDVALSLKMSIERRETRLKNCTRSALTLVWMRYYRTSTLSYLPKDLVKLIAEALSDTFWESCWLK